MMFLNIRHLLHCLALLMFITLPPTFLSATEKFDSWLEYGTFWTIFIYATHFQVFCGIILFSPGILGMIFYDAFPGKVHLKNNLKDAPFLCFRVVTRGDYPNLVKQNLMKNLELCQNVGVENFTIEVVTDNPINIVQTPKTKETLVPNEYETKTKAKFKARALQYSLDDSVDVLQPRSWIVHLDEETLMTEDSIRGILNFVLDGKHAIGQGMITYASGNVENWITTLADSSRIADEMGKNQLVMKLLNRPIFGMKGSFIVARVKFFKNVLNTFKSFDKYFSMKQSVT